MKVKQFIVKKENFESVNKFFEENSVTFLSIKTAPGAWFKICGEDIKLWRTGEYDLNKGSRITFKISEDVIDFIEAGGYPYLDIQIIYEEGVDE